MSPSDTSGYDKYTEYCQPGELTQASMSIVLGGGGFCRLAWSVLSWIIGYMIQYSVPLPSPKFRPIWYILAQRPNPLIIWLTFLAWPLIAHLEYFHSHTLSRGPPGVTQWAETIRCGPRGPAWITKTDTPKDRKFQVFRARFLTGTKASHVLHYTELLLLC